MNKLLAVALIIALHLIFNQFLPWWNIALASAIAVMITRIRKSLSFLIPAITVAALWGIWMFILDQKTGFYISQRIAKLFEAQGILSFAIPVAGAFIISGFSGLAGNLLLNTFKKTVVIENQMNLDDYKESQEDLKEKGIL